MSIQTIKSDLLVDLSTEEQQLLSGGQNFRARGLYQGRNGSSYPVFINGSIDFNRPLGGGDFGGGGSGRGGFGGGGFEG